MTFAAEPVLQPDATLVCLPTHASQLNIDATGQQVLDLFQAQPELPGVIILAQSQPVALIPQAKFYARLNQPFGRELYLKRSIQVLLEAIELNAPPLVLPETCPIVDAVQAALSRHSAYVYDPIITTNGRDYQLLNSQTLLLAHAQMLHQMHEVFIGQNLTLQRLTRQLQEQEHQLQACQSQLTTMIEQSRDREILEQQHQELRHQTKQLHRQHQQLRGLGQLSTEETEIALEAALESNEKVQTELAQILRLGCQFEQELEIMDGASREIEHISRQVKHLALQASLILGRISGQADSFGFITTEITKLGEQCVHANKQIVGIAQRFRERIPAVQQAAQAGTTASQELLEQIRPAQLNQRQFASFLKTLNPVA